MRLQIPTWSALNAYDKWTGVLWCLVAAIDTNLFAAVLAAVYVIKCVNVARDMKNYDKLSTYLRRHADMSEKMFGEIAVMNAQAEAQGVCPCCRRPLRQVEQAK